MASCTQIEKLLQAYIDGETGSAERVMVDQHVRDCRACHALLGKHQRVAALAFEAMAPYKLGRSLRGPVMENLPEMDRRTVDLAGVNWRAKHPVFWSSQLARLMPVAVMIILALAVVVLQEKWPHPTSTAAVVGVVSHASGSALQYDEDAQARGPARVGAFVSAGCYFETPAGATLMASLMGPSYMKMNEGTRLRVESERRVKVEEGEAWFNVGCDGRLFRVATPNGNITVFGTSFAVKVLPEQTIVTVQSGQVKVENETSVFRVLKAGQQARSRAGEPVSVPVAYAGNDLAWIDGIHAEARAEHLFYDSLMPRRAKTAELSAKELYWVDTSQGGRSWVVGAVRLTWDAESAEQQLISGYTVYVYDEKGNPLQKDYIPASVFAQKDTTSYEIRIKEKPLGGVGNLMVELAPDSPASKLSFRVTASGS
ncbi:MAG TPA: FecR domain-containing protein [Candidatus Hydrogenedentes bacterium]|nr:FecR domain-containing protein [Candidatus Hydrogenedentota bacterium]